MMQASTKGASYLVTDACSTVTSISVGKHFKKSDFAVGLRMEANHDFHGGRNHRTSECAPSFSSLEVVTTEK